MHVCRPAGAPSSGFNRTSSMGLPSSQAPEAKPHHHHCHGHRHPKPDSNGVRDGVFAA
ncbi:MAG: hypothetical protein JWM80_4496 [Cyanobacteria bacterium RYN_339]|nr:hypothetical protein [Cyanobacteria bacterium RYN_339]